MSLPLDLFAIREGVKATIIAGVGRTLNVYARYPDTAMQLPAVLIEPAGDYVSYFEAFSGGLGEVQLSLRLYCQGDDQGQRTLDELLSSGTGEANSVLDAIMADRSLGGVVQDAVPLKARHVGKVELLPASGVASIPAWAAVLDLTILASRT